MRRRSVALPTSSAFSQTPMSSTHGIIYEIENLQTGKRYVGQTTGTLQQRFREHSRGTRMLISQAIRKYGEANFRSSVLAEGRDQRELDSLEVHWIAERQSLAPNGYNLTTGGFGGKR